MDKEYLEKLLKDVKNGTRSVEEVLHELQSFSIKDLGFAKLDYHRELRRGYP